VPLTDTAAARRAINDEAQELSEKLIKAAEMIVFKVGPKAPFRTKKLAAEHTLERVLDGDTVAAAVEAAGGQVRTRGVAIVDELSSLGLDVALARLLTTTGGIRKLRASLAATADELESRYRAAVVGSASAADPTTLAKKEAEAAALVKQAEAAEQAKQLSAQEYQQTLGLSAKDFAEAIGLGEKTFHRWLKGTQVVSRSMGYYLRALQRFPESFAWVRERGWRSPESPPVRGNPSSRDWAPHP
jgi:DNA-binding transcriptional regulator YiaG